MLWWVIRNHFIWLTSNISALSRVIFYMYACKYKYSSIHTLCLYYRYLWHCNRTLLTGYILMPHYKNLKLCCSRHTNCNNIPPNPFKTSVIFTAGKFNTNGERSHTTMSLSVTNYTSGFLKGVNQKSLPVINNGQVRWLLSWTISYEREDCWCMWGMCFIEQG